MPKFIVQSDHQEDLADGRVVLPGSRIELKESDLKDPHNKRLVDEGVLLQHEPSGKKEDK